MVSFQHKLATGLDRLGIEACFDLSDWPYQAVLVIGGTRQLGMLWRARRRGARIVQRLDGMNWLHRVRESGHRPRPSLRHYLRAEYGNNLLTLIRARLADSIIYQSEFSRRWWERVHGPTKSPNRVVHNGVNLVTYHPHGPGGPPADRWRVLLVEGSLMGGYETGLEAAVGLVDQLQKAAPPPGKVELMVVGKVSPTVQQIWRENAGIDIQWAGLFPQEQIPQIDRSAHLLYSADLNAACPNSVIEALACGLPVVAFDTGALPELVTPGAGQIASYGGDPWKLEPPDISGLCQAALEVINDLPGFRRGARQRAEEAFSLENMVAGYLSALFDGGAGR
jgi:glycosyltransferase involved in cell wall biosynthesis